MQPHAGLIIAGVKITEDRSWRTAYRGRLWVHAGMAVDTDAPSLEDLPLNQSRILELVAVRGAIIGYVTLTGITGSPGAYEWHLAAPHELAEPVFCRGWPALWRWPR